MQKLVYLLFLVRLLIYLRALFFVTMMIAILLAAGIAALYFYPRDMIETYASHAIGRAVTVGQAKITFNPLHIDLEDMHVANPAWAAEPDIFSVRHVAAEIEVMPLLTGNLKFNHLIVDNAKLLLERDDKGQGNWKRATTLQAPRKSSDEGAESRSNFPTILDLTLHNSQILLRTRSHAELTIALGNLELRTADEYQDVLIHVDGSYNNIPVSMHIKTGGYKALHDVTHAFPVDISAEGATSTIDMALTLMDPLNFDRFQGKIQIGAKKLGQVAQLFGVQVQWNAPLTLESELTRTGDVWNLTGARGALAGNRYDKSDFTLSEGTGETPDDLLAALHFNALTVDTLLAPAPTHTSHESLRNMKVGVSENPSMVLHAQLTSSIISYGKLQAANFTLRAGLIPGSAMINDISMEMFGGQIQGSASVQTVKEVSAATARLEIKHVDAKRMMRGFYPAADIISGAIGATLSVTAKGSEIQDIVRSLQGRFMLSLARGMLQRRVIWMASTDARALVNKGTAMIPVSCLQAELRFTKGIGTLSPFELSTPEGTLLGAGTVDMPRGVFDLTFRTAPKTTSALALDVPIHITGTLADPHVLPLGGSRNAIDTGNIRHGDCQ